MVVVGDSAGGYLTLAAGYRVNPKPKALVALYGYGEFNQDTDATIVSDSTGRKDQAGTFYPYQLSGMWPREMTELNPNSFAKESARYEPFKNVTNSYPPTLLIHGTQDTDVPFEESVKMSEQFREHGVPYILLPIDKGEHGFAGGSDAQIDAAFRTMKEFMLRYLEPQ